MKVMIRHQLDLLGCDCPKCRVVDCCSHVEVEIGKSEVTKQKLLLRTDSSSSPPTAPARPPKLVSRPRSARGSPVHGSADSNRHNGIRPSRVSRSLW
jgi:hypothetical protein